jgi:two-component system chemotaxis response regulator CheY
MAKRAASCPAASVCTRGLTMKTIFVVDDSPTMRKSLAASLALAGFEVSTACNGQTAMALINQGLKPDLILTDINMPEMDGIAFIQAARGKLRFTPILALTNAGQPGKRDEARQSGATGWLKKPVGGTELIQIIEQFIGAPQP